MRLDRRSVRVRVTALATIVVAIVLVVSGVALVVIQRSELSDSLDRELVRRLDRVEDELASSPVEEVARRFAAPTGEDEILQFNSLTGGVLAVSSNLDGDSIDGVPMDSFATVDVPSVDDDSFRAAARRMVAGDTEVVAVVALTTDDVLEGTQTLTTALVIVLPMVLALLGAVIWRLIGRTLQPVEAIRSEVASIDSTDLHRRVPVPASGDEIARLARTMNSMLDRLEEANRRQQRFVGDASHELRGPLTRIRTVLEVDLTAAAVDPVRTHAELLEEVVGMERLVDDLLHLAQADHGAVLSQRIAFDLDDIVLEECRRLRGGRVDIDTRGVSGATVVGDPAQLRRAVRNLVDNAVRHAESSVIVHLVETGEVDLLVEDDGPGIAEEDRAAVFDRFARLDSARSSAAGGTGLGLAITKEIVERHGGAITIRESAMGGAAFRVTLPADDDRR